MRSALEVIFVAAAVTIVIVISLAPNNQGAKLFPVDLVRLDDVPLGRLVAVAGHLTSQQWSRYLAEHHGLTPAGMKVLLVILNGQGEVTHRELAEACFVRPATLTGIVDTLERDGLVERRRGSSDRRQIQLALTPDGERHARKLGGLIKQNRPLTSVDADPAKAAVIREFLLELIKTMSHGEDEK
jgi:DNA-binding MarR family transcriptional regulator